jgi:hypothetical protein
LETLATLGFAGSSDRAALGLISGRLENLAAVFSWYYFSKRQAIAVT